MSNPLTKDREQEIRIQKWGRLAETIDRLRAALDECRCAECGEKIWISPEDGQLHIASVKAAQSRLAKAIATLESAEQKLTYTGHPIAYDKACEVAAGIRQTLKELKA